MAPAASASEHMKKASFRIPGSSEREYVISDVGRRWDENQRRGSRDGESETETTEGAEGTGQHFNTEERGHGGNGGDRRAALRAPGGGGGPQRKTEPQKTPPRILRPPAPPPAPAT